MIKVVYCITKKPDMSQEEFFDYWKNVHGPIGAQIPGLLRLVQSHTIRDSNDTREPDYDGVAELWFEDMVALREARESEEWARSSVDEEIFIDHKKVAYLVTSEYEIPLEGR